jgi:hypothetical protein
LEIEKSTFPPLWALAEISNSFSAYTQASELSQNKNIVGFPY